jgi:LPS O-antigen subunit length determinant protein (WzzB/FepE family)
MEEYEVDLRDYLRVMWERKWLIVGVFTAALVAAAAYSYTLPDEYEANALLQWESRIPFQSSRLPDGPPQDNALEPSALLPSSKEVAELIETMTAYNDPSGLKFEAETLGNSDFISAALKGPLPPQQLEESLAQHIASVQALLNKRVREDIQQQIAILEGRQEFFAQQRARLLEEIQRWISLRQEGLRQQRQKLLEQLQKLPNPEEKGPDSLTQSYIILQAYTTLTNQIIAVERELRRLEEEQKVSSPRPGSGFDAQLDEVDRTLRQLELAKFEYERALEMNWTPLRVIREPQGSLEPIGPPRQLNVAIAGVLGLFVGVLLAFFAHYLQGSESIRLEPQTQTIQTQGGGS